jgi:cell wall-associated NlpC family hydrolase
MALQGASGSVGKAGGLLTPMNSAELRESLMTLYDGPGSTLSAPEISSLVAHVGDPPTGSTTTAGLAPGMKARVSAMMQANPNIKITSGHRTSAQQAYLYAAKGGRGVAKPGQSAHQTGQAADLGPPSQFGWIAKNASKFGLARPAPRSEPWHVQAMGDPTGSQIVAKARTWLGTPYSWGGGSDTGPTLGTAQGSGTVGFDCSAFVMSVFSSFGIQLPRTSQEQATKGTKVPNLGLAQAGDLLFFDYGGPNSHVGIYIGGGQMIDAPDTGSKVSIQSVDTGHLDAIRRVTGLQAGSAVATAAAALR